MSLLTKTLMKTLPGRREQDGLGDEAIAHAKFFTPDAQWTWYVLEAEVVPDDVAGGYDVEFFGFVVGQFAELGYFTLSQLQSVRGGLGLEVERDRWFRPKRLSEVKTELGIPLGAGVVEA